MLTGRTSLHGHILGAVGNLLAEARAAALGMGHEVAWIERVVVSTEPVVDAATLRQREDAMGEIRRQLDQAAEDPALVEKLKADIGDFLNKLPHEIRSELDSEMSQAVLDEDYPRMIQDASDYLLARLTEEEG